MNLSRRSLLAGLLAIPFGVRAGPVVAVPPTFGGGTVLGLTNFPNRPKYEPETTLMAAFISEEFHWERKCVGLHHVAYFTHNLQGECRELIRITALPLTYHMEYVFEVPEDMDQRQVLEMRKELQDYVGGVQRYMAIQGCRCYPAAIADKQGFLITVGMTFDECVALAAEGRYEPYAAKLELGL